MTPKFILTLEFDTEQELVKWSNIVASAILESEKREIERQMNPPVEEKLKLILSWVRAGKLKTPTAYHLQCSERFSISKTNWLKEQWEMIYEACLYGDIVKDLKGFGEVARQDLEKCLKNHFGYDDER